jgi:hypothetical protein
LKLQLLSEAGDFGGQIGDLLVLQFGCQASCKRKSPLPLCLQ